MSEKSAFEKVSFTDLSTPAKALATAIIITMSFGMLGALGQIYIHDIIPTFYSQSATEENNMVKAIHDTADEQGHMPVMPASGRGDLFSDFDSEQPESRPEPIYKNEQFVWTLKWTHIHLFGMSAIFILMGAITLLLNMSTKARTWLIILPFIGVVVDIAAMWLKAFVSPVFFWLHVPGGGVFGVIFIYVSLRALWEMWGNRQPLKPIQ